MPIVVDASVALAWCFKDEATPSTDAVLDQVARDTAVVPSVWELEVVNALLVAERRARVTEFQVGRSIRLLGELPIVVDLTPTDLRTVAAAGQRHRLSAYDATYLVLAERDGLPLATLDEDLRAAAGNAGVPLVIGPG
ncbi:MAG: PIN domain-containing protein [Streptosporangiales bacterium]|nr:PIN domain-containing protein [Streptosporangiales bacterium]